MERDAASSTSDKGASPGVHPATLRAASISWGVWWALLWTLILLGHPTLDDPSIITWLYVPMQATLGIFILTLATLAIWRGQGLGLALRALGFFGACMVVVGAAFGFLLAQESPNDEAAFPTTSVVTAALTALAWVFAGVLCLRAWKEERHLKEAAAASRRSSRRALAPSASTSKAATP